MKTVEANFEIVRPSAEEAEHYARQSVEDTYDAFQAECQRIVPRNVSHHRFETPDDVSASLRPQGAGVASDTLYEDQYLLDLRGATIVDAENSIAYSGVMKLRACLQSPWASRDEREIPGSPSIGMEYWIEALGGPVAGPITPHFLEDLGIHDVLRARIPRELAQGRNDVVDETIVTAGVDDEAGENSRLIKVAFGAVTVALKGTPDYEEPDWSTFHQVIPSRSTDRERLETLHRY